jgi:hypothetical protein
MDIFIYTFQNDTVAHSDRISEFQCWTVIKLESTKSISTKSTLVAEKLVEELGQSLRRRTCFLGSIPARGSDADLGLSWSSKLGPAAGDRARDGRSVWRRSSVTCPAERRRLARGRGYWAEKIRWGWTGAGGGEVRPMWRRGWSAGWRRGVGLFP